MPISKLIKKTLPEQEEMTEDAINMAKAIRDVIIEDIYASIGHLKNLNNGAEELIGRLVEKTLSDQIRVSNEVKSNYELSAKGMKEEFEKSIRSVKEQLYKDMADTVRTIDASYATQLKTINDSYEKRLRQMEGVYNKCLEQLIEHLKSLPAPQVIVPEKALKVDVHTKAMIEPSKMKTTKTIIYDQNTGRPNQIIEEGGML